MNNQDLALNESDLSALINNAVESLPQEPSEQDLQGCAFDVRRALISQVMDNISHDLENTENKTLDHEHNFEHYEDILRKNLAPMQSPSLSRIPKPSALRNALLAVLGLFFGSSIGQGLSTIPHLGLGSALVVIFGILGVVATLKVAEHILQAFQHGKITLPWGIYSYTKARKFFIMGWFGLLAITALRDFFGGRTTLLHFFESLNLFLSTGNILNIFTNIYGVLFFIGCVGLLIKRPTVFDKADFSKQLSVASQNWFNGAHLCAKLLVENDELKNNPSREYWQQVGRDIYSFAHELPSAQRHWLTERLNKLGIKILTHEQSLTWNKQMLELYIPLGHIDDGDACYVDEPPILEDDVVVRKGTIRKIR